MQLDDGFSYGEASNQDAKLTIEIMLLELGINRSDKVEELKDCEQGAVFEGEYNITICQVSLLTPFPPFSVMNSNQSSLYSIFQPGSRLGVYTTYVTNS